jgi:hypothetical protein
MLNCEKKAQVWKIAKMYEVEGPEMRHGSMEVKKVSTPVKKTNYNLMWLSPKPLPKAIFVWHQWSGQVPCCYLSLFYDD